MYVLDLACSELVPAKSDQVSEREVKQLSIFFYLEPSEKYTDRLGIGDKIFLLFQLFHLHAEVQKGDMRLNNNERTGKTQTLFLTRSLNNNRSLYVDQLKRSSKTIDSLGNCSFDLGKDFSMI